MEISKKEIDSLNAVLTVDVKESDYSEKVKTVLNNYRKSANIPGFRKGHVPMGLVKQKYGKAVLVEEVNKLLQESLHNYLTEEKLEIGGDRHLSIDRLRGDRFRPASESDASAPNLPGPDQKCKHGLPFPFRTTTDFPQALWNHLKSTVFKLFFQYPRALEPVPVSELGTRTVLDEPHLLCG